MPAADGSPYRWEFTEDGNDFSVSVDAQVLTTDPELNIRLDFKGRGSVRVLERLPRASRMKGFGLRLLSSGRATL